MEKAAALIQQYVPPNPAQIQKAKDAGNMLLRPPPAGKVRVEFPDFVQPSDLMAIDVDAKAALLSALSVATYLEKQEDAVTLNVRFGHACRRHQLRGADRHSTPRPRTSASSSRTPAIVRSRSDLRVRLGCGPDRQAHRRWRSSSRIAEAVLRPCVAEFLLEVDQWLLADLQEPLVRSVEVDHEREDRSHGDDEHHDAHDAATTGQTTAVPHQAHRQHGSDHEDEDDGLRHASVDPSGDPRGVQVNQLVERNDEEAQDFRIRGLAGQLFGLRPEFVMDSLRPGVVSL